MVNRCGINHVVVVQHEDKIIRDGGDFIEQGCQHQFSGRRAEEIGEQPTSLLQLSAQSSVKQ